MLHDRDRTHDVVVTTYQIQTSGTYIGVNTPVRKSAGSNPVFVYVFKAN